MATRRYCAQCLTTFPDDPPACPNLGCGAGRPASGWSPILGAGDLIDRHYKVDRPLAVGGAGITYLAREIDGHNLPTGPALAVKVLFEQRDSGPFLRRLNTEAQILQDLAHPNIVECRAFVHRMGHAPYLVTRFEAGGNLADHVKRVGPLPPAVATGILRQILLALDVAHARGVVHRDLKPHNVLLAEATPARLVPHVRVADFGIAKVGAGGEGMTITGGFVGTPEYAAPEQFAGVPATAATDIFAAGGLLIFLLTGQTPFLYSQRHDIARTYSELLAQLPPKAPPVGAPSERQLVQRVLQMTMRKEPQDRAPIRDLLVQIADLAEAPAPLGSGWQPEADQSAPELAAVAGTFMLGEVDPPGFTPLPDMPPATAQPTPIAAPLRNVLPPKKPSTPLPPPLPPTLDPARRTPEPQRATRNDQPSLDDLLSPRSRSVLPAPEPIRTVETLPAGRRPPPPPPPTTWQPDVPRPVPADLPEDTNGLLTLLGDAAVIDRHILVDRLSRAPDLVAIGRMHRPGSPSSSRGLAIAIAALGKAELAPVAARLLADANPSVRACAAEAVAAVGKAPALPPLQRLLSDPEPLVRVLAAAAVAKGCKANGRADLARRWLEPLVRDPEADVRAAARQALGTLGN
jgi:serine/threonine protein kinase